MNARLQVSSAKAERDLGWTHHALYGTLRDEVVWYRFQRGTNAWLATDQRPRRLRRFAMKPTIIAALAVLLTTAIARSSTHQGKEETSMATVSVRYIVDDVAAAISFYTQHLGFSLDLHPAPGFATLSRANLRLLLNVQGAGGAGQAMPDGRQPAPGGWNRIQLEVTDMASKVESLRQAGARFRNDIVIGNGGKQILLDDPSGHPIELFEPPPR